METPSPADLLHDLGILCLSTIPMNPAGNNLRPSPLATHFAPNVQNLFTSQPDHTSGEGSKSASEHSPVSSDGPSPTSQNVQGSLSLSALHPPYTDSTNGSGSTSVSPFSPHSTAGGFPLHIDPTSVGIHGIDPNFMSAGENGMNRGVARGGQGIVFSSDHSLNEGGRLEDGKEEFDFFADFTASDTINVVV